jgi:glycosyltransferase involved in cell wall biosynthesis
MIYTYNNGNRQDVAFRKTDAPQGKKLEDILEIFLITYNRKKELAATLKALFAEKSPVRDVRFTILDNASTDGADDLCEDYVKRYPNIRHIRHPKNIGGNANICRAFEMADAEYVWVLADDDGYTWSHWPQIENAMWEGFDGIFTTLVNLSRIVGPGAVLYECCFVPGCIYRTTWINSDVLQGMYGNIYTCVPHITISLAMLKNHGRFFIPSKAVVIQEAKLEYLPSISGKDYTKGISENYSPIMKDKFWEIGFLHLISMLDAETQHQVFTDIKNLYTNKEQYINFLLENFKNNNYSIRNIFDIYWGLSERDKKTFIKLLYQFFDIDPIKKSPLSLDEWNLLLADRIAVKDFKRKIRLEQIRRSMALHHPITSRLKKVIIWLLVKVLKRISTVPV